MAEKLTPAQAQTVANIIRKFLQEEIAPIDLELAARTGVLEHLKSFSSEVSQAIDEQLTAVRNSSALQEKLRQKYQVDVNRRLRQFVEGLQELESLESTLRDLKPGQLN